MTDLADIFRAFAMAFPLEVAKDDNFFRPTSGPANDNTADRKPRMVRVVCEVCGCGFVHRQAGRGRRRRFCSTECRHKRELAWKARWRSAERDAQRGPLLPFDKEAPTMSNADDTADETRVAAVTEAVAKLGLKLGPGFTPEIIFEGAVKGATVQLIAARKVGAREVATLLTDLALAFDESGNLETVN